MEEFVVSFLDVDPMITALRTRPLDFEMDGSWLHHFPSHHRFKVDQEGNVKIDAPCDCAILHVRCEQGHELWHAFQIWYSAYWQPTLINREFARHFRSPNLLERVYCGLRVKVYHAFRHNGRSRIARECHVSAKTSADTTPANTNLVAPRAI
jgi:hypothetical protein